MPNERILIIEDDLTFSRIVSNFLQKNDFEVRIFHKAKEALQAFEEESYQLVLTDFRLPDLNGMEVLRKIKDKNNAIPVILMTSYSDIRTAVKAMKQGATEYITKPVNPDELLLTIRQALEKDEPAETEASEEPSAHPSKKRSKLSFNYVQGVSEAAQRVHEQVELVSPTNMSVIVLGESGTGKEYISRMIHHLSKRNGQSFVALDCGALSKDLAASELFGHKKGAFTGALQDKVGHFEEANGGTIFLDEVGNLSYEVQVKLLRALQERKIKRLGSNNDIDVDVRIITATNDDLMQSVKEGGFREDLYHRLNEFSIRIMPLRERKKDILFYARHFLEQSNQELSKSVKGFSPDVEDTFERYPWPGNLRELKNIVKRAVLLAKEDTIMMACLPSEMIAEAVLDGPPPPIANESDLKKINEQNERELIVKTLIKVRYNKSKAAKLLNIDRKTLYNKIEKYNIKI